jgi:hypothetical protein
MPFPPVSLGREYPMRGSSQASRKQDRNQSVATKGNPEVALNQKVKKLIQKLGEAIHESVSESENIAGVVKNIRDQGFDVLLMLEATIGLNEVEAESPETEESAQEEAAGLFTHKDLHFLKSLRISLPAEDSGPLSLNPPASEKRGLDSSSQSSAGSDPLPGT